MSDANKERGGCLCGKIRYEIDSSKVLAAHNCHCTDCQKSTGCGFVTFLAIMDTDFQILSGEWNTYEVAGESGSWVRRSFCPECGSPVFSKSQLGQDMMLIKAGSLDNSDWLEVSSSFWSDTARSWAPVNPDCPTTARNPY